MVLVAAGLLLRRRRLLLARRPPGTHLAGRWEFPGGKVEPGEAPDRALVRELGEELGVEATAVAPLSFVHHRYPEREVLILLYRVAFRGEPQALHADRLGWFTLREARALPLPAADLPLLAAVAEALGRGSAPRRPPPAGARAAAG